MHTESNPWDLVGANEVITATDVAVRYRLPHEHIPSFKEYAIRWLQGRVGHHDFWALRSVSVGIQKGESIGIIGPNGAGKTTLLKVISRVLRPTRGRIRVRGRLAPLLELGAGFDSELTGRENMYLNGAILGFSKSHMTERQERIVDFAGLRDFIDVPLRTYSSGMVVRLGFAVASDERPDIMLIDEMLGIGDADFQAKSLGRIREFQAAGTTIVFVSHDMRQMAEMCTRAAWMEHGEIAACGPAGDVVEKYLDRYGVRQPAASPPGPARIVNGT